MNSFTRVLLGVAPHWRTGVLAIAGTVGIAVMCRRCLETDKARAERAQRMKEKEIRALADRIASYGRTVHRRYPTGDVVVGENDLAAQLRKRPDIVGTALNLLLARTQAPEGSAQWILEAERVTTSELISTWDAAVGRKLFIVRGFARGHAATGLSTPLYLYLLLLLAILIKVHGNSTAPPLKPEPWRPDGTVSYFGRCLNFGAKIQKECEIGVRAFEHPQ